MLADVGQGAALIKLEGARQPLEEKIALAHGLLGNAMSRSEEDLFAAIGCGEKFADIPGDIWRVMIARADAPRLVKELNVRHWLGDWAGAVLWLAADPSEATRIRAIAANANGQAMLLRASAASRASLGLFAPQPPALAALNRAVKAAFDPLSLFNPGRL
jgi:glycolate oxidase FAD binding subunit